MKENNQFSENTEEEILNAGPTDPDKSPELKPQTNAGKSDEKPLNEEEPDEEELDDVEDDDDADENEQGDKDRKTGFKGLSKLKKGKSAKAPKLVKPVDKRNKSLKMISVSSAVLFIAIVIIFNVIFESFLGDSLKWDWTQTNMFSVGDVTKELVGKMEKNIKIVGLYDKGTNSSFKDIEVLLDEYVKMSKGKITVEYVNPVSTPSILTKVDPDGLLKPEEGSFVVRCEDTKKGKVLTSADLFKTEMDYTTYQTNITGVTAENAFSGAIVYTTSEKTPVVYMTTGHDEAAYATKYTSMVSVLTDNNFLVKDLNMLTSAKVPDDAALIIMLSPEKDINETEKDLLTTYLKTGKSLLVMTDFNSAAFPVLNTLLADYNIEISNDRVREGNKDRRYQEDPYFFIANAPVSFITTKAVDDMTLVRGVRAITELKNAKEYVKVQPIFQTGAEALVEKNGDENKAGPAGIATIGIASENTGFMDGDKVTTSTKVMVTGMSDYIGDEIIKTFGSQVYNMYSFYYSVKWLANVEGDGLMITAKEMPSYTLSSGNNTSYWIATIVCLILIPVGFLIVALIVYRRRKNM